MEFLVYKLHKTGQGLSGVESTLFADFIGGSYLWAGVPADVFVTPQTTQQARRDKAKSWEYRCRITVKRLAATQAWLKDLDLAAQKRWELKENPVGQGWGMICRADKYLAQQHGRELPWATGLGAGSICIPRKDCYTKWLSFSVWALRVRVWLRGDQPWRAWGWPGGRWCICEFWLYLQIKRAGYWSDPWD